MPARSGIEISLKVRLCPADVAFVENPAELLFQRHGAAHGQEVMAHGYWTDNLTSREYAVVSVAEGSGNPQQPGIKQWVARGYKKTA